jgi:hypothetical protein
MEIFELLEEIKKETNNLKKLMQEDPFEKWITQKLKTSKKRKHGSK